MYLGLALLLIGWAVWFGSASPRLIPPLFVIVITVVQIIPEEAIWFYMCGSRI
jgi:protein-S-isoprenylcysteine O-methyltransferase Ste14